MATIKPDQLGDAVAQALEEYTEDVFSDVQDSARSAAQVALRILRMKSPVRTGAYRKGWRIRTAFESATDLRLEVYNATSYQLTHLLEHGHELPYPTPAHPHIKPAADEAAEVLMKNVQLKVVEK